MWKKTLGGALVLGAFCLAYFDYSRLQSHRPAFTVAGQRPGPAFDLETLDGKRFSSDSLFRKVALVDFWATWCQPCIEEIPIWNELEARYGAQGFTVLGVTVQSGWASDIKSDVEKSKWEFKYPVVVGDERIVQEFGGIMGLPTTFLTTREGRIYKKYTGQYPGKRAEIEADIRKLLEKY